MWQNYELHAVAKNIPLIKKIKTPILTTFRIKINEKQKKIFIWKDFKILKFYATEFNTPNPVGAMETPHRGNVSLRKCLKKKRKPLKRRFFWVVSLISVRNTEIPLNPVFEGFPFYFEAFPKIFEASPLFSWQIFFRDFPIFLRCSAKCLRCFRIF